jgi:hypothetical protein
MKRVDVKIAYRPWSGDRQVAKEDATANFVGHYEINGYWIGDDTVRLDFDGFISIAVKREPPAEAYPLTRSQHLDLLAGFTEEDWLDTSTDDEIVLLVSRLDFVELEPHEAIAA